MGKLVKQESRIEQKALGMGPRLGTPVSKYSWKYRKLGIFSHGHLCTYRWAGGKDTRRHAGWQGKSQGWFRGTRELCRRVWMAPLWVKVHLPFFSNYSGLGRPPTLKLAWPSVSAVIANINSELLNNSLHRLGSYFLTWKNNFWKKKKKPHYKIKLGLVFKMWRLAPQHVFHSFFKLGKEEW